VAFPGLQHIATTVSDLDRSTASYGSLFGADPVLDEDEESGTFHHTVFLLDGGTMVGLHTHMGAESKDRADERRTGLDHIGFGLSGTIELELWKGRLDALGIEHGDIKKAHYGTGITFRDPDNIALEFFIAPGT
jgi:catechol 2,3-dioxygenase-like lactoylglutathione lyase family enzyme